MDDSTTPNRKDPIDVPALHATGLRDRMTAPLPMPFSLRGMLRRVFRGRQAPWQTVIRESMLPADVMQTIAVIVRRTRLWSSEKSDVARELCAHFADGIEAGTPAQDLCRDFGEPKAAAKLIRAAKRRGRPLWWQAWKYALRGAACVVLLMLGVYGVLALIFVASSPTITRNYSAELNAKILATPEEARAWPRYLVALREIGKVPTELETSLEVAGDAPDSVKREDIWPQKPGQQRWPMAAAWVNSKREAVLKVRQAAAMEHLGFPLSDQLPDDYRTLEAELSGKPPEPAGPHAENPILTMVLIPYLGQFRKLARVLVVDARIAVQEKDADRFVADIRAICGMAHHCDEVPILINKLVSVALLALAIDTAKQPLGTALLDEAHLRDLAHTFASFDDTVLDAPLGMERQFLQDIVQRTYSDNGAGDGHMTREGFALMQSVMGSSGGGTGTGLTPLETALSPLSVAATASRKELTDEADRLYGMFERDAKTPLWKIDRPQADSEVERLRASGLRGMKYAVLTTIVPAISRVHYSLEQARQTRDGILVALALESYRRVHGTYPASLEALVPSLLPTVPPDRFDGKPIKYRLVGDGSAARPVVYSIGVDRVDDGGREPKDAKHVWDMLRYRSAADAKTALENPRSHDAVSGDAVLYKPE